VRVGVTQGARPLWRSTHRLLCYRRMSETRDLADKLDEIGHTSNLFNETPESARGAAESGQRPRRERPYSKLEGHNRGCRARGIARKLTAWTQAHGRTLLSRRAAAARSALRRLPCSAFPPTTPRWRRTSCSVPPPRHRLARRRALHTYFDLLSIASINPRPEVRIARERPARRP